MKKIHLIAACGTLIAASASAQYVVPTSTHGNAAWEIDAGVGYVFNTNQSSLDNGTSLHLGGYKLMPATATRNMVTKFGGELYYSSVDGNNNLQLDTLFLSADIGVGYRFTKSVEFGITAGVGVGRLSYDVGSRSDSSNCVGMQIRPEVIFHVNDQVGVSLGYRFLQTFPLDSDWTTNPNQHGIELSVRVAF